MAVGVTHPNWLVDFFRSIRGRSLEDQDRRWNLGFSLPAVVFLGIFFIAPFLFIFLFAFGYYSATYQVVGGFHFDNFINILNGTTLELLIRTVQVAGLVTALSLVLGYPIAYYLAGLPRERRELLLMILIIPFWTSFLLRTFSLWMIFNDEGLANQIIRTLGMTPTFTTGNRDSVVWAETYAFLPFMVLPMYATIERMSRSSIEASYILGAGRIETFVRVILPLSMPGIVAGSLLVFIIAMGEVVIPQIMGGGDYGYLLGNAILARHAEVPGDMASLGLLFMGVVLVFVFGYLRVAGRGGLRL